MFLKPFFLTVYIVMCASFFLLNIRIISNTRIPYVGLAVMLSYIIIIWTPIHKIYSIVKSLTRLCCMLYMRLWPSFVRTSNMYDPDAEIMI